MHVRTCKSSIELLCPIKLLSNEHRASEKGIGLGKEGQLESSAMFHFG